MVTATATGAAATSTACGTSYQYELPVHDAACGVPNQANYSTIFDSCALPAGVRPYNNDCALYALAVEQSVQDLTDCLYKGGVAWADVWCTGDVNSTATATSFPTPTKAISTSTSKTTEDTKFSTTKSGTAATASATGGARAVTITTKSAVGLVGIVVMAILC
ncbi:hypothetical protein ASPACDRAFT_125033 [Aspergillus aculeatus ATCC 16872]|uniref:Uncharacterized protein n=1 Tax=Aspergillus aculeatus (strain ATCC 16872 / CBS 172.66 / WB 5094) TaxID=690307 RepID=A0A1L9WJU3_ASPA1|nr:uncharacterized protein ASPACDRAFT_125033 [Aspergillus aculeatus ATCC 16872]OJJ96430.1 hypothetical protein ASPACDRAFT_125033 [Aspergillus aculeatus ATCC 16872]